MSVSPPDLPTGESVRRACREGRWNAPTPGLAPGFVQANLVALPADLADEFAAFCAANPSPCPLIERVAAGSFEAISTAPGSDVRHDLPRYRVYRDRETFEVMTDVASVWRDDLVTFLTGCSFTFEYKLAAAGLPIRHVDLGLNVPMYVTNRTCTPAGRFHGPLVVSMRPMTPEQARRAADVTAGMPMAHGAPVHAGNPAALGIPDLDQPSFGDAVPIRPGEIPVFWACGVTGEEAVRRAAPPFAVTHDPGHMFVTDIRID